jgi:hypothetical protein
MANIDLHNIDRHTLLPHTSAPLAASTGNTIGGRGITPTYLYRHPIDIMQR